MIVYLCKQQLRNCHSERSAAGMQSKNLKEDPSAPLRINYGMIATGNHIYPNLLRRAPRSG